MCISSKNSDSIGAMECATGGGDYRGNMHCWWLISAEEHQEIDVTFSFISTEKDVDIITLHRSKLSLQYKKNVFSSILPTDQSNNFFA